MKYNYYYGIVSSLISKAIVENPKYMASIEHLAPIYGSFTWALADACDCIILKYEL